MKRERAISPRCVIILFSRGHVALPTTTTATVTAAATVAIVVAAAVVAVAVALVALVAAAVSDFIVSFLHLLFLLFPTLILMPVLILYLDLVDIINVI